MAFREGRRTIVKLCELHVKFVLIVVEMMLRVKVVELVVTVVVLVLVVAVAVVVVVALAVAVVVVKERPLHCSCGQLPNPNRLFERNGRGTACLKMAALPLILLH